MNAIDPVLAQWTIYDHPSDYPNNFVAREWLVSRAGALPARMAINPDVNVLRDYIQTVLPGAVCLTRSPSDDPVIVETWT
jgi:hypothetical protein